MPAAEPSTGELMGHAAALGSAHVEDTMYPPLVRALETVLPTGYRALSHGGTGARNKPDLAIFNRSGGKVANIEVKHASSIRAAFAPGPTGLHQIERYRSDGIPVLLTDAVRWYEVTASDDIDRAVATFDGSDDEVAEQQLRDVLHIVCGVRPRHTSDTAVLAISGVIAQINAADQGALAEGWEVVREGLGLVVGADSLDQAGVGEIVAFTLLSIASQLPALPDRTFASAAVNEWRTDFDHWDPSSLPSMMSATLTGFRDQDRQAEILGAAGWTTLRSIAAWLTASRGDGRWSRLSGLWDDYLHRVGRRRTLGSWQTHRGVADYQAAQVHEALERLGYAGGFGNDAVTVVDPCVGTGVYLEAVIERARADGTPPEAFNAAAAGSYPRLVGADISSTAVAASHIRLSATGARPALYMTDTLATSGSGSIARLFRSTGHGFNAIIGAADHDHDELQRWAVRQPGRDPVLAVIGNPPYKRSGLDVSRYREVGWMVDGFDHWRRGSGGRGSLEDLFVGFWAWAVNLCRQEHAAIRQHVADGGEAEEGRLFSLDDGSRQRMFGVVSFITNRTWVDGDTFGPMRKWIAARAARVEVSDFGPGTRGGGADRWSEQPFPIETGTAIVTITFDPRAPAGDVTYRRATWEGNRVRVGPVEVVEDPSRPWTNPRRGRSLVDPSQGQVSGIRTGDDNRWIRVDGDRNFGTRHAYRAFDNRWSPTTPPPRAPRSRDPLPNEAKPSAFWRDEALFNPHRDHRAAGGWYAIVQAERASARPGPAVHATRHLPDNDAFKGSEGGIVIRVGPGLPIPRDYDEWAIPFGLTGPTFWLYALAAGHHLDYWTAGTELAQQIAEKRVEVPLADDPAAVRRLVELGEELVGLWTLDDVEPVRFSGAPGRWHFERHNEVDGVTVNFRAALGRWREARPGDWDQRRATEYARSIAALLRVREIAGEVARVLAE